VKEFSYSFKDVVVTLDCLGCDLIKLGNEFMAPDYFLVHF